MKADDVKGWHMIPCDEKLQAKWIAASKREPPYPKKDRDFQFCGIHFADECFERNIMVELMGSKSYNLKEDAVPTIFLSSKSMRKRNSSEIRAARHVKKELISQIEVENLPCSSIKADEMGNDDVEDLKEEIEFESENESESKNDEDSMEEHLEIFKPFEFHMVLVSWINMSPNFMPLRAASHNAV